MIFLRRPDGLLENTLDLRQRLFRRLVVVRLETVPAALPDTVRRLGFVTGITQEGNELQVDLTDPDRNRPELVKCIVEAGGRVLEVTEEQHSLEEVYLSLVKEQR